jgi:hypothetical protein
MDTFEKTMESMSRNGQKEPAALRAVTLLNDLGIDVPVVDKPVHDGTGPPVIGWIVGHPEMVKNDPHPLERLFKMGMELLRECPR